jgi:hypothetical protein
MTAKLKRRFFVKKSVFFQKATQLIRRSGGCTVFDSSGGKWFLRKEPDLEWVWGEGSDPRL